MPFRCSQFLRSVTHSAGAHSSKLCDAPTDSDSDTSSDEEQPDADTSTKAVVETVATPDSDMNDCNVYLVALSRLWHVATSVFVRLRKRRGTSGAWMSHLLHRHLNDPVFSDVQLRYVNSSLTS